MLSIHLGQDVCPQAFSETLDQYFFIKSRDRVILFKHGLQIFQLSNLIHNVFLLILCVFFDLTSETIYKDFQIAKSLVQKRFEFVPDRWNHILIILLLFMLLLAETDVILKEKFCKKYVIKFFCFGDIKMIFTLLKEIIASHVVITPINVKKAFLEWIFIKIFYNSKSGFHYCFNNLLHFLIQINP